MNYIAILFFLIFFSLNFKSKAQYYDFDKDNFIVSVGYAPSRIAEYTPYGSNYFHGTDLKLFYQINKNTIRYGVGLQHMLRGSRYSYLKMHNDRENVKLTAYKVQSISLPLYAKKPVFKTMFIKLTLAPTFIYKATGTGIYDFQDTPEEFIVNSKNLLKTEAEHFGSIDPINQFNIYASLSLLKEIEIKNHNFEVGIEYAIDIFDTIEIGRNYRRPYDKLHWLSLSVALVID